MQIQEQLQILTKKNKKTKKHGNQRNQENQGNQYTQGNQGNLGFQCNLVFSGPPGKQSQSGCQKVVFSFIKEIPKCFFTGPMQTRWSAFEWISVLSSLMVAKYNSNYILGNKMPPRPPLQLHMDLTLVNGFSLNRPLHDIVYKLRCPSVCMCVCPLTFFMSFF